MVFNAAENFASLRSNIDSISIFKQTGTTVENILHGHIIIKGNVRNYRIKVIRSVNELWTLFYDPTEGQNFSIDNSAADTTYKFTQTFDVYFKYNSSNKTAFYFDNFYAGIGDLIPPSVISVAVVLPTQRQK